MSKWDQYGEKFMELRSQGMSYRRIADQVSVSVTTLKAWGLKWESDIKRLADGRLDEFVEAHLLDVRSRLQLRGGQIQRMSLELESRDFSDMDTGELLRLLVRYVESVQKDVDPLKVEVNSTMQNYEQIILRCARIETEPDAPGVLPDASKP